MIHRFSVVISEDLSRGRKKEELHLLGVSLGPVSQWGVTPHKHRFALVTV